MDDTQSLIHRTLQGDLDAFGEIIARFQDMAVGYAHSVLGDFGLAEDAAQEAFLTAYQTLGNLREHSRFPGWFRRILVGSCDRILRTGRQRGVSLDEVAELPAGEGDPHRAAERAEMRERVLSAVGALSKPLRTTATLYYIDGYTVDEVADFLEVPPGTVKYRLHESRKQLRQEMVRMVKDTLAQGRPSSAFGEKVLEQVSLGFPPGVVTESIHGDKGTITFFLSTRDAAGLPGAVGLIGLTFDRVAAATIIPGPFRDSVLTEAARPRCELLDVVCGLLSDSHVTMERVVLDVGRGQQVSAVTVCRGADGPTETALPASVALSPAHRMKTKVFATPKLMQQGAAGEGHLPEMNRKAIGELKEEILKHRLRNELLELAWQNGLDPDAGSRAVRWRIDESAGTIDVLVSKRRRPVADVELRKYRGAVEQLRRDAANPRYYGRQVRDERMYALKLEDLGGDIRCVVRRVK